MNLEMKLNCPKEENINQKQSDHLQILKWKQTFKTFVLLK
jgi:hypothetical protein